MPYEDVDCEVRYLVRLINAFDGIRTVSSCAGHTPEESQTTIVFVADSQESVCGLMAALPFCGFRGGFVNNYPQTEFICLAVSILESRLVYTLYIGGSPRYTQRGLVGKVEQALVSALPHPLETHLSYPMCDSTRNEDKGQPCYR